MFIHKRKNKTKMNPKITLKYKGFKFDQKLLFLVA